MYTHNFTGNCLIQADRYLHKVISNTERHSNLTCLHLSTRLGGLYKVIYSTTELLYWSALCTSKYNGPNVPRQYGKQTGYLQKVLCTGLLVDSLNWSSQGRSSLNNLVLSVHDSPGVYNLMCAQKLWGDIILKIQNKT